jgi:8-amino-7-oxononanoate synthase
MIDLSSALYLEMRHAHHDIPGWRQMTTGVPASVREDVRSIAVGQAIAGMQGLERGLTGASTLHLFEDLYSWLADMPVTLYVDEFVYPVARCGIEKLTVKGIPIHPYRHQQAAHLAVLMRRSANKNRIPVVLTDGWCPQCGRPAPLHPITGLLARHGGIGVMDDTQALGLLGERSAGRAGGLRPNNDQWSSAYGRGGGGLLRWSAAPGDRMLSITSLAKSFGVPMAVISGSHRLIGEFRASSGTVDHSSPPSIAHLSAAQRALTINSEEGDCRRRRLFAGVTRFKQRLSMAGISSKGGLFPVQHLGGLSQDSLLSLHQALEKDDIRTVLTKDHQSPVPQLTLLFRAGLRDEEIDRVTDKLIRFYTKKTIHYGNDH